MSLLPRDHTVGIHLMECGGHLPWKKLPWDPCPVQGELVGESTSFVTP